MEIDLRADNRTCNSRIKIMSTHHSLAMLHKTVLVTVDSRQGVVLQLWVGRGVKNF